MGEPSPLIDWRVRAASGVGATLACAALLALLLIASRTFIAREQAVVGVEVLLTERVRDVRAEAARPRAPGAPSSPATQAPQPTVDAAMMSRLLRCVRRPGQPRPPDCPQEAGPEDWRRPQLPVGGVYAQPEQPDLDRIYTRAERETLVMPSCVRDGVDGMVGVCVPFGTRPPPPSRSPEQICRDANLGGPCAPPPERAPR